MIARIARSRSCGRGASAVELLTLLVLVIILAAFAIPGMSPVVQRHRLRGAAWQLAGDLRLARQRAVTVRKSFRLCVTGCTISLPPGSYSVERDDGTSTPVWVSDTGAPVRLPPDVTVGASATPVFYANGMATLGSTFTITNAVGSYQVKVASTGRVKVCEGAC